MNFKSYLEKHGFRQSTISGHVQDLKRFENWCKDQNIDPSKASYDHLLKFIQFKQKDGVSKSTINNHLNSIHKYFDYLIESDESLSAEQAGKDFVLRRAQANPAKDLRLKNRGRKVHVHLLSPDQLDTLYMSFQIRHEWEYKGEYTKKAHRRNSVILGLLVYQGIQSSELSLLEKGHLNLLQGSVYIPSSAKGNSRILKLNASQILPIQNYLQDLPKEQEKLFGSSKLSNYLSWIMRALRKSVENEKINGPHIRASVIMNWLKLYNIRQVQYMAGHKQISTTERYKEEDIHDLQKQLELYHPFS